MGAKLVRKQFDQQGMIANLSYQEDLDYIIASIYCDVNCAKVNQDLFFKRVMDLSVNEKYDNLDIYMMLYSKCSATLSFYEKLGIKPNM